LSPLFCFGSIGNSGYEANCPLGPRTYFSCLACNFSVGAGFSDVGFSTSSWGYRCFGIIKVVNSRVWCRVLLICHFLLKAKGVATPLWRKCEVTTHALENGTWESSGTFENLERDRKGQNTSHWSVHYTVGNSWNADVQNGLTWAIWTSVTQVMVERKARSQTGNLTPNH